MRISFHLFVKQSVGGLIATETAKRKWHIEHPDTPLPETYLIVAIPCLIEGESIVPNLDGLWRLDPWHTTGENTDSRLWTLLIGAIGRERTRHDSLDGYVAKIR